MAKKKLTIDDVLVPKEEIPYEVPENWCWVYTPLLFDIKYGKNLPTSKLTEKGYPVYGANGVIGFYNEYNYDLPKVLISCRGANSGVINISQENSFITNNSLVMCNKLDMSIDFIKYLFMSMDKKDLISGTAQPQITVKAFDKFPIPLPPLGEQERIVNIIEGLFEKIDNASELIEEARDGFEKRRASILEKAFSGELTKSWREKNSDGESAKDLLQKIKLKREELYKESVEPSKLLGNKKPAKIHSFVDFIEEGSDLPEGWIKTKLYNLTYDFRYGSSEKSDYSFKGKPVIRIPNLQNLKISIEDLKYLKSDEVDENNIVKNGDIVLIRSNGSATLVGKTAIIGEAEEGMAFASYLIRIRPCLVNPKYILYALNSTSAKSQFFSKSKSTSGINNINTQELGETIIALPPLNEQDEIVRIIEKLLEMENSIDLLSDVSDLETSIKKAILAKAFRGELSTNDLKEESSVNLLKELL
ncbi:MAG: restriction endonuclease subunit S [Intestinibacter sp.]|uniref:restriction endonuclease subunit S n=1 Tax=Intestinibacter sp. TaxID=1965304 RepID=UPI003F17B612